MTTRKEITDLKKEFGKEYAVEIEETYSHEKDHLRAPIEHYYIIPSKYGHFFLWGGNVIGYLCTSSRLKKRILGQFKDQVHVYLDGDGESILKFEKSIFRGVATLAKAKKRRGRKSLLEDEKNRLMIAGKQYQFTGKSIQFNEQEGNLMSPSIQRHAGDS